MPHRLKRRHRLIAHALRGAVGSHQLGIFFLEGPQVGEQPVVVAVADLWRSFNVILPVVMPDLLSQPVDLLGGRCGHG